MIITGIDIAVIAAYLVVVFGIGVVLSRRASRDTEEFFVSGRSLPWWLIGTSMVATTFAADTPLVVSGLVARGGIWQNWIWWHWGIGAVFTVFLFARLWNRAGITTDAELIELRYDGKPAAALRFYRAAWFGIFQNILVIAWVMKAMAKIIIVVMGWQEAGEVLGMNPEVFIVMCLFLVTVSYTVMSGLWGVVMTDFLQFALAMGGSIFLAVISWKSIGGMDGIRAGLASGGFDVEQTLRVVPGFDSILSANPFTEFLLLVLVVWWASYTIDGGGYLAQRLFAAKNEKHAVFGYLWFCIAHVALRPWPWIIVGLCGMAFFGSVDDPETYYPLVMRELLRPGMLGLMLASFFAAFMSTIDSQLNWGSSLVVNDLLRRFLWKGRSEKEYVLTARLAIIGLALLGAGSSFLVRDISFAWKLIISVTAGVGSVYVARWYWWRVNAWSEITAMAVAMAATFVLSVLSRRPGLEGSPWLQFPYSTALTAALSVIVWVAVTFATKPVGDERLREFHGRVRPGGPGWRRFRDGTEKSRYSEAVVNIFAGLLVVFGMLVGFGGFILGRPVEGVVATALAVAGGVILLFTMRGDKE